MLVASAADATGQADREEPVSFYGPLIVVVARKIEEPILDTPLSVSAVGGEPLEDHGGGFDRLARLVPNLNFAQDGLFGHGQLAIRGIYSSVGAATVATYLDESPILTRPLDFAGPVVIEPFDLDRIEVSRGPQGALFGAGALGGVVRLRTRQPDLHDWSMRARSSVETTQNGALGYSAGIATGGPVIQDRWAFRLAAVGRREGGFVDRVDRRSGETSSADVNARRIGMLRLSTTARAGNLTLVGAVHLQRARNEDLPLFESSRGAFRQAFILPQPGRDELLLGLIRASLDLGGAVVETIVSRLDRDYVQQSDYSTVFGELALGGDPPGLVPPGGTANLVDVEQQNRNWEVRVRSADQGGTVRWLAGAVAARSLFRLRQQVVEPGIAQLTRERLGLSVEEAFGAPMLAGGVSYLGEEEVVERELALFAEATWRPISILDLTAGLRVARSRLSLSVASAGPYAGTAAPIEEGGEQSETPLLPRVAALLRLSPSLRAFAAASRGYRVGGANTPVPQAPCRDDLRAIDRDSAPADFREDSVWSYEIGLKAAIPGPNLLATASAFRIDWSGIQQAVRLPTCGFSFVDNLGDARSQGFEFEAQASPAPGLALRAAIGFTDARFTRTIGAADGPILVAQGDRIPFTPRWSGSASVEYRWAVDGSATALVGAGYQYAGSSRRGVGPDAAGHNSSTFNAEAHGVAEFRLGAAMGPWEVTASIDNLFDARPILFSSADLVPATGSPLRQTSLRPRRFRLALSLTL